MDMLALVAALSVMVTIILVMLALYWSSTSNHAVSARARLEAVVGGAPAIDGGPVGAPLREKRFSSLPGLSSLLSGREWARDVEQELERADVNLRVGEYATIRLAAAFLFLMVPIVIIGASAPGLIVGLVAALVGYMLPRIYVSHRRKARLEKLNGQLEETLTLVSNSLKAGFGLLQSLEQASQQMEHPISTEFRRLLHDINVGSTTEQALVDLSQRVGSYDLDIVITAILIQRTAGGNLAEILDTVAHTMRERSRIKGEIRVMTSQQRMTGYILGGLPLAVSAILFLVARDYMTPLFTTAPGLAMLAGAGIWELMGVFLMRRILAIEV
jgi:tight adherence protein B